MMIQNHERLAVSELRRAVLAIAEAGLDAIATPEVIKKQISLKDRILIFKDEHYALRQFRRVFVVAVGKSSLDAAATLENIFGQVITGGIVIDTRPGTLKKIKVYCGTHPLPSQKNIRFTKAAIELLEKSRQDDLVIFVISGGGSTLLCQPVPGFSLSQEIKLVRKLFEAGAKIEEINVIRKHSSLARGGLLAKYAYPSQVVSLIFSDVPGDNLEYIASGPTVKDTTTVADAQKILKEFGLGKIFPALPHLLIETPKEDKYFSRVSNLLVLSNVVALAAMAGEAKKLGYDAKIMSRRLIGEARVVGPEIAADLHAAPDHTVLLYGGETTVVVKGRGKGGRNQELSLSALPFVDNNELILSLASDGRDNTEYAGGICDIITKAAAKRAKLVSEHFLNQNNSFEFFRRTGQYVQTGHTGSNVADLIIAIRN